MAGPDEQDDAEVDRFEQFRSDQETFISSIGDPGVVGEYQADAYKHGYQDAIERVREFIEDDCYEGFENPSISQILEFLRDIDHEIDHQVGSGE